MPRKRIMGRSWMASRMALGFKGSGARRGASPSVAEPGVEALRDLNPPAARPKPPGSCWPSPLQHARGHLRLCKGEAVTGLRRPQAPAWAAPGQAPGEAATARQQEPASGLEAAREGSRRPLTARSGSLCPDRERPGRQSLGRRHGAATRMPGSAPL
mmetsp:Transcript_114610/g.370319  ORF Transcript_114610/g.370319 Transcript_114610/m.370319 type:complete len:157 (-) Transcript_114610:2400-2870(-)